MNDTSRRLRTLLQQCLDTSGLGQSALAKFLGLAPSAVSRMLSGERQISAVELLGMKEFFNISFSEIERALDLNINNEADLLVIAHDRITQEEYASNYHIAAYEEDKSGISLPGFMIESLRLTRTDYLRWVRISDDAMAPAINRGDVIIVDLSMIGGVGTFLLEVTPGQLSVRRLDGRWEEDDLLVHVTADNPKFRSYETSLMKVKVIGHVLMVITITA